MDQKDNAPVFVHSLFRSGSTYIFNAFRRSEAGYWPYQEPLNETLIDNAKRDGGFQAGPETANEYLRHPELDKSHTYEFHVAADEVVRRFRKNFPYKLFFSQSQEELVELVEYLRVLQERARGRPVFQCCRTTGRVRPLKEAFPGVHLFLWRDPWDQWWSYKSDAYFEARNLFILCAKDAPAILQILKEEIGFPSFRNVSEESADVYCDNRQLPPAASYRLFYALWCLAMMDARPLCDLDISIDALTLVGQYREERLAQLESLGVVGLDFSDCNVPRPLYGEEDAAFFKAQEEHVHQLFLRCGRAESLVAQLREMSAARMARVVDTSLAENAAVRDAMRARSIALQATASASALQQELLETRKLMRAGKPQAAVRH